MGKKITILLIIITSVIVFITFWMYKGINKEELIGGQRDEHGCLGPAGYSWCEIKSKCLRVWEEPCE